MSRALVDSDVFDRWIADPRDLTFAEFLLDAQAPRAKGTERFAALGLGGSYSFDVAAQQRQQMDFAKQSMRHCLGDPRSES